MSGPAPADRPADGPEGGSGRAALNGPEEDRGVPESAAARYARHMREALHAERAERRRLRGLRRAVRRAHGWRRLGAWLRADYRWVGVLGLVVAVVAVVWLIGVFLFVLWAGGAFHQEMTPHATPTR